MCIRDSVYSAPGRTGQGGWSWYTGAAAWMYRAWVEEVLGLKLRGESLRMDPVIPNGWPGFDLTYRHGEAVYEIHVDNAAGVENRQAVLAPDGVVGRVIKVFPRSALVLLVTDRSSGIDAIVQRTRDRGVVQGRGGSGCELKYLDRSAEVEVGDYVVTSGMGGRFPKGVWIGQVSGVNRGGDSFQSVDVRPSAGLDRLEEVLVITGAPEDGR